MSIEQNKDDFETRMVRLEEIIYNDHKHLEELVEAFDGLQKEYSSGMEISIETMIFENEDMKEKISEIRAAIDR
jgi:hypothetical protein